MFIFLIKTTVGFCMCFDSKANWDNTQLVK